MRRRVYVVMAPKGGDDPLQYELIADRFRAGAFFAAPLWALSGGRYILTLLTSVALAGVWWGVARFGFEPALVATFAVALLIGFESGALMRWELGLRGWRPIGLVEAVGEDDALRLWLGRDARTGLLADRGDPA